MKRRAFLSAFSLGLVPIAGTVGVAAGETAPPSNVHDALREVMAAVRERYIPHNGTGEVWLKPHYVEDAIDEIERRHRVYTEGKQHEERC